MLYRLPSPPTTLSVDAPTVTFKSLAHQAAHLSPSGKAGLGGQVARGEVRATRPTRLIAAIATGASSSTIARALKASPAERAALVAGTTTLSDLAAKEAAEPCFDFGTVMPVPKPYMTVAEMLLAYCELTSAEQVLFGREIGVNRVWLPQQRRVHSR
jgi:hypothetical protein